MKRKKVNVLGAIKAHQKTKDMSDDEVIDHVKKEKQGSAVDGARLVRALRNKRKKAD